MAKMDLKNTYFALPIGEPDKKYLRFRWKGQMHQFNCLPFGLSCAPWVFTKITEAVACNGLCKQLLCVSTLHNLTFVAS